MKLTLSLSLLISVSAIESGLYSTTINITNDGNGCTTLIRNFDKLIHKPKYRIGVYADESNKITIESYNLTFAKYLTETAGRRFDPPISFDIVPISLFSLDEMVEEKVVDFSFATPSVASCMETERDAEPLVTVVNRRMCRGYEYDLDVYGGVIFTLANNKQVNTIQDLKGKTIGAGGFMTMGGGQTQFYEMVKHGLSFVSDPKQVVITNDGRKVVKGVLDGDFEVGFVRTDQIERYLDEAGELLALDTFKVLNQRTHILHDGNLFPFLSSTDLHPEWPLIAFGHVSKDVSKEVQDALLALEDHATSIEMKQKLRCDTNPQIAALAMQAKEAGHLAGFRTARSYASVRNKQEVAGLLRHNGYGELKCIRGIDLYNDIDCPDDQYKLTEDEFYSSCMDKGIECDESKGYSCYCSPCVKAFDVSVYQYFEDEEQPTGTIIGCDKMSLCGQGQQTKQVTFRAIDNVKRDNAKIEVKVHLNHETSQIQVRKVPDEPYTYEFNWAQDKVGVGLFEIYVNSVQIPESPIRVQITNRDCSVDYPGQSMVPTEDGTCECGSGTVDVGGQCVATAIFAIAGSLGGLLLAIIGGYFYVVYRNKKADEMWQVKIEELHFADPVEVIGQGSFGVVLLAEYRGTKVAIKRAIRSTDKKGSSKHSKAYRSTGTSVGQSKGSVASGGSSGSVGVVSVDSSYDATIDSSGTVSVDLESPNSGGTCNNTAEVGRSKKSSDDWSLNFLAEDFGLKKKKWAWLFPWLGRNDDYHTRFKESILGESTSMSKTTIAARLFPWCNSQARRQEEFMQEMRILSRLRHPCITTVMGAVVSSSHDPMLLMEYMEFGSLYDLLHNETMHLSGDVIIQIIRDIAQGLRHLHGSTPPILHGDLKARNILIDSRFRAKLCDFGLSTKATNLITGTPFWMAPEYLRGQCKYNAACDMYSIGIILFEIYARTNPYHGEDFREVLRGVCNRRINKRPTIPATMPSKMVELMKKCWNAEPSYRPDAKELDLTVTEMSTSDAEPVDPEADKRKKRSGEMLYELFPKHVADAIKAGKKVEPENHDLVTVIFSDIVHFTDISKEISPLKVSNMLDRLYLAFDNVAEKHKVFKVETIGDAYMGVTNLENNQEDTHVKRAAEFAVDLISEASKILIDEEDPNKGYINIRVGFHSGPVVSNVIGTLNPRYGLFGDTVNTASRMESNSFANRILCSAQSYKLLKDQAPDMPAKKRGKINVKGKGDMNVYWVGEGLAQVGPKPNVTTRGPEVKFAEIDDEGLDKKEES